MSPLLVALLSTVVSVGCWRPMVPRDPFRDPTFEYRPPVAYYWIEEPPSASLTPPKPGPPSLWLYTETADDQSPSDSLQPLDYSPLLIPATSSEPTPQTTTSPTPPPIEITTALVIEGHSKVKKYGPVEGSINSVLYQSGKV